MSDAQKRIERVKRLGSAASMVLTGVKSKEFTGVRMEVHYLIPIEEWRREPIPSAGDWNELQAALVKDLAASLDILQKIAKHLFVPFDWAWTSGQLDEHLIAALEQLRAERDAARKGEAEHFENIATAFKRVDEAHQDRLAMQQALADALAAVKEWICPKCRHVYPKVAPETIAVICPRCQDAAVPLLAFEAIELRRELAALKAEEPLSIGLLNGARALVEHRDSEGKQIKNLVDRLAAALGLSLASLPHGTTIADWLCGVAAGQRVELSELRHDLREEEKRHQRAAVDRDEARARTRQCFEVMEQQYLAAEQARKEAARDRDALRSDIEAMVGERDLLRDTVAKLRAESAAPYRVAAAVIDAMRWALICHGTNHTDELRAQLARYEQAALPEALQEIERRHRLAALCHGRSKEHDDRATLLTAVRTLLTVNEKLDEQRREDEARAEEAETARARYEAAALEIARGAG